jgi:putative peptide zinc metalloprotease protein
MAPLFRPLALGERPLVYPSSRVTFRDYFARREGDEYVVGRAETSTYLAVPPIGVDVMQLLAQGLTVQEAATRLRDRDGETPDVGDFVETMIAYGLVAAVDGVALPDSEPPGASVHDGRLFGKIRCRYTAWLFSRPAFALHVAVFLAVIVALAVRPRYVPSSADFFVYHKYALNLLLVLGTVVVCGLLHELGHLLAAHGRGLAGRVQLRRPLREIGIDAEFPDAWRLPRRDRIVVYLGGVVVTVWLFGAALGLLLWDGSALPATLERWLRLVLVVQLWLFVWQLHFFKETDGYWIAADLLQAKGLMEDTRASVRALRERFTRRRPSPALELPDSRRRAVRTYTVLYLVGVAVAVGFIGGFILPFVVGSARAAVDALGSGAAGVARRADAAALLALYALIVAIILAAVRKKPAPARGDA